MHVFIIKLNDERCAPKHWILAGHLEQPLAEYPFTPTCLPKSAAEGDSSKPFKRL
jgi:hypothetical protein